MFTVSVLLFALYVLLIVLAVRKYRWELYPYYMFAAFQAWCIASSLYNDSGIYNFELRRVTEFSYASIVLTALNLAFHFTLVATYRAIRRREPWSELELRPMGTLILGALVFVIFVVVSMCLYRVFTVTGGAVVVNRAVYFDSATKLETVFLKYANVSCFILGLFVVARRKLLLPALIMGCIASYLFLVGNKFSAFVSVGFAFSYPVLLELSRLLRGRSIRQRLSEIRRVHFNLVSLTKTALVLVVVFSAGLFSAYDKYMDELHDVVAARELLLNRVLGYQSSIWWGTYSHYSHHGYEPSQLSREYEYAVHGVGSENDVGMRHLMIDMLGKTLALKIFKTGYLYTMAFPAILISMLPMPGVVFGCSLFAILLVLSIAYVNRCIRKQYYVRAIVAFSILMPLIDFLSSGSFVVIVTLGMAVKMLSLVFIELWSDLVRSESPVT